MFEYTIITNGWTYLHSSKYNMLECMLDYWIHPIFTYNDQSLWDFFKERKIKGLQGPLEYVLGLQLWLSLFTCTNPKPLLVQGTSQLHLHKDLPCFVV